ncbi:MAG: glycosyltransferase family 2 protein [Rhodospirillales bacterium]|nr:glycosyltransferase family 2 protein [Rhodospirillales bacterium]
MAPRVSLAMPVFNGENYISTAIESILAQDFSDIELIITDNASVDGTKDICEAYAKRDSRVRYAPNSKNLGAAPNYNRGFELARGEFLKWCAHDDLISANFVSVCVKALDDDPKATLAFARTQCIDTDGKEIAGEDSEEMESILDERPEDRFYKAITMGGTCFPIFGLFRMTALRKSTLHRLYYGSDRALIAETALLGRCLRMDEAIFYNREHPRRSIRMVDHAERSRWQNASGGRRRWSTSAWPLTSSKSRAVIRTWLIRPMPSGRWPESP